MKEKYSLEPKKTKRISTKHRQIVTDLPVPESIEILKEMRKYEPFSMAGQPPVIWDRAEGVYVYDRWGNKWLDFSSGVLITNVGHGHPRIVKRIKEISSRPLLSTYVFYHELRKELVKELNSLAPESTYKVFLLTTGSEAIENAIKLSYTYAQKKYGNKRKYFVSFVNAFHGRTMGAQLAGGLSHLKTWLTPINAPFIQVPFPDGYKNEDVRFELFLETLEEYKVKPEEIVGVISESYQGVGPDFFPEEYAKKLEEFCKTHDIVLIMDEVQAGFGRTGKMFCFEHYGIKPDIICCGKGISSSLPISAVIGRQDIMDLYPPGSMTSTHSGSPLPVACALESIKILREEKLVENAASLDNCLREGLLEIQRKCPEIVGCVQSRGLVAGLQIVKPHSKDPDPQLALRINEECFLRGLLMFAPVGVKGECIKIAPPLCITKDALEEGIEVLKEVILGIK